MSIDKYLRAKLEPVQREPRVELEPVQKEPKELNIPDKYLSRNLEPVQKKPGEDLYYIVKDAQMGRREIPVGTGEVEVCTGHMIVHDKMFGGVGLRKRRYVPVYETRKF